MALILTTQLAPGKPKLLDQVRDAIRLRHYSIRTEQAYTDWIKRFILFHNKRHPREMSEEEVSAFLTHLAKASPSFPEAPPFTAGRFTVGGKSLRVCCQGFTLSRESVLVCFKGLRICHKTSTP